MEDARIRTVEFDYEIPDDVIQNLTMIEKQYGPNGISFKVKDNCIEYRLKEIDFKAFRNQIMALENSDNGGIYLAIYKDIDSIKSYGLKNKKRIYAGYNEERKTRDRKTKVLKRAGYYYAIDNNFSDKNNDLPQEYENKIVCADSLEHLKTLPDNCIDLIFTSPPYNFGLEYEDDQDDDAKKWEHYFSTLFAIFDECIRVLKYSGRIVVNVQPLFSDYIPTHHVISNYFMSKKLIWKGEIIWEKNNYNCKYTSWGSWKSPSNPYLKYTWEFVEVFCKGEMKKPGRAEDADILPEEFKKWVVAKWSVAPERNMKQFGHPAMFPEELALRVIKLFSYAGDIVLDPFNGVGTTTLVARLNNRRYLGIDISDEYCKKAVDRLESYLF